MPRTRFHIELESRVNDEIDKQSKGVASGNCHDYSVYQYSVGLIRGLKMALEIADDMVREADSDERDRSS